MIRSLAAAAIVGVLVLIGAPASAATRDVAAEDDVFEPREITVVAGDRIRWTNGGERPHTVTATDGSFDWTLQSGESFSRRFPEPGTVRYWCRLHGTEDGDGMAGVVRVRAASAGDAHPASDALPRTGASLGLLALMGACAAIAGWSARGYAIEAGGRRRA